MASPKVKFKRSSVAGKKPSLANLDSGELALNTYDGKVFLRVDTGGIGIGTTVSTVNPWTENYGASGISYGGQVDITGVTTFRSDVNFDGGIVSAGIVTALRYESTQGGISNFYAGNEAGSNAGSGAVQNTGVGQNALQDLTTGDYNSSFGASSGLNITEGYSNVTIGAYSGDTLTTGYENTLVGTNAGGTLNSGRIRNTFIGANSGYAASNADYGTFVGHSAGYNCEGDYNIALGYQAGYNSSSSYAINIGAYAGTNSSSSLYNISIGYVAGNDLEGTGNIALGYETLRYHNGGGDYNIALGYQAKRLDGSDSSYNVAIGYQAMYGASDTTGDYNIAIGNQAGHDITSGSGNILLGSQAGDSITSGSSNVVIVGGEGSTIDVDSATEDGQLVIGYGSTSWITGNKDREVTIAGVATVYGATGIISATKYYGDGSSLTGISAGAGGTENVSSNTTISGIITASSQFYPPTLTTAERDALSVTQGALIFNTTENKVQMYLGSEWKSLAFELDSYSVIGI